MRTLEHPARHELSLDAVLAALADPVRRLIVCRLRDKAENPACARFDLPVSKSTATHHFRVLREAGLITQQYQGTSILNALRSDDLAARFPGLIDAVFAAQHIEDASLFDHPESSSPLP